MSFGSYVVVSLCQSLIRFERRFVNQGAYERRDIYTSLDMAWELLRIFPVHMLRRIPEKILQEYYHRPNSYLASHENKKEENTTAPH